MNAKLPSINIDETFPVTAQKCVLMADFDGLDAYLDQQLQQFDTIVTDDAVTEARKTAAKLNKSKAAINKVVKSHIATVSEPILKFKARAAESIAKIDSVRNSVTDQIEKFDAETRKKAVVEIEKRTASEVAEKQIRDEFSILISTCDLAKNTALTKKGKLTGAVVSEIKLRANNALNLQNQTDTRLLSLENTCFRAGLAEPLTRTHVEHFLFADHVVYTEKLSELIAAEVDRQERAKQSKVVASGVQTINESKPDPIPAPEVVAETQVETNAPNNDESKIDVRVTCSFKISVPGSISMESIENGLRARLEGAGFTSLESIKSEILF